MSVSFCDGTSHTTAKALSDFTTGASSVLLLSAKAKASGANLQYATNVILLDPAGSSAKHGAALEQQAIGRAVRMGQANASRFCVRNSIEEALFAQIDEADSKLVQRSNDLSYTCENSHKSLGLVSEEAAEDDDIDDCCIGETLTDRERVARKHAEALANNDVTCIDDSDDEDEKKPAAKKVESSTPSYGVALVSKVSTDSMTTNGKCAKEIESENQSLKKVKTDAYAEAAAGTDRLETQAPSHSIASEKNAHMPEEPFISWKDQEWLKRVQELKLLKEKTGLAFESGQITPLSKWCFQQRAAYKRGSLSAFRLNPLESIGFPWTHRENYLKQTTPAGKFNANAAAHEHLPLVTPALRHKFEAAATPIEASTTNNSDRVVSPTDQVVSHSA